MTYYSFLVDLFNQYSIHFNGGFYIVMVVVIIFCPAFLGKQNPLRLSNNLKEKGSGITLQKGIHCVFPSNSAVPQIFTTPTKNVQQGESGSW